MSDFSEFRELIGSDWSESNKALFAFYASKNSYTGDEAVAVYKAFKTKYPDVVPQMNEILELLKTKEVTHAISNLTQEEQKRLIRLIDCSGNKFVDLRKMSRKIAIKIVREKYDPELVEEIFSHYGNNFFIAAGKYMSAYQSRRRA